MTARESRPSAAATTGRAVFQTRSEETGELSYCLVDGVDALNEQRWGDRPPPWAPGRREEATQVDRAAAHEDKAWCMSEVDIFRDLSAAEMDAIAGHP